MQEIRSTSSLDLMTLKVVVSFNSVKNWWITPIQRTLCPSEFADGIIIWISMSS